MVDDSKALDEVVVIGYGTVNKRDLTGSVASVSAKDLAAIPVASASEALTGKLAGVSVTTTEGSPDADIKIRVRGGGSLSQDNSPLYIVDGFPVSSISDIAPSEIQSIDVLKDASSTAIYGARGANGVIIITTKSGKEGKTQVDFGASFGFKQVTKLTEVLVLTISLLISVKSVLWIMETLPIWISGVLLMVPITKTRCSDVLETSNNTTLM